MGVRSIIPLPMMRPQSFTNAPMMRPVERKKRGKKSSSASQLISPTSGEDAPLAARRERRTPRKAVDYSKFFKDEGPDAEEEESGVSDGDDSDEASRPRKRKASSFAKRPRPVYSSDNDEMGETSDEENLATVLLLRMWA